MSIVVRCRSSRPWSPPPPPQPAMARARNKTAAVLPKFRSKFIFKAPLSSCRCGPRLGPRRRLRYHLQSGMQPRTGHIFLRLPMVHKSPAVQEFYTAPEGQVRPAPNRRRTRAAASYSLSRSVFSVGLECRLRRRFPGKDRTACPGAVARERAGAASGALAFPIAARPLRAALSETHLRCQLIDLALSFPRRDCSRKQAGARSRTTR